MIYITLEVAMDGGDNGLLNQVIALVSSLAKLLGKLKGPEVCATYSVKEEE
jgi:hypothetical protein